MQCTSRATAAATNLLWPYEVGLWLVGHLSIIARHRYCHTERHHHHQQQQQQQPGTLNNSLSDELALRCRSLARSLEVAVAFMTSYPAVQSVNAAQSLEPRAVHHSPTPSL